MKKIINAASLVVLTLVFTLSAFAQNSNEKKNEAYNKIAKLSQTKKPEDQEKAFNLGKDFLAQYGKEGSDEQVKKIKDFIEKYRISLFNKKLDEGKTAEAFALGREILAQEPENTYVVMNLAYGGYDALNKRKDKSFDSDSINYARQAISLMEGGKLPTTFEPFKNQADAAGVMYYVIGSFQMDSDPQEAAKNFYKALQYDSQIKDSSYAYFAIAYGYEKAYEKLANEYQAKAPKASEAELKEMQDKLMKVADRMLDAYARAIKFAETDNNSAREEWKRRFAEVYKYRNGSETGMNEYLNSAATKPLPDPKTL